MSSDAHSKSKFCKLLQKAASIAVAEEDVWAKHDIPSIPAERVIRHQYDAMSGTFTSEETIVKMQSEPFAHGAMRHCFRMKKLATPPQSASNHRFHSYGWSRASNYVAKAYMTKTTTTTTTTTVVDCSASAKAAVQNDIILQHEANVWALAFNRGNPPKKIVFLRAFAIEFPNRPGSPWFAVERFIAGRDSYGAGFVKHNTNSGFVDPELHRTTPQVFSAHSFYQSQGTRLVADIQGVGDLYTDPQVLSIDYRFGDGDLGPRGMALFFHSFRHCSTSDWMGIPIFPLSKNELKQQAKYHDDDATLSDEEDDDDKPEGDDGEHRLLQLDLNRMRRNSVLKLPTDIFPSDMAATTKRSNVIMAVPPSSQCVRSSIRTTMTHHSRKHPNVLSRSKSDVDELSYSLMYATRDAVFDHAAFHRKASGEIRERTSERSSRTKGNHENYYNNNNRNENSSMIHQSVCSNEASPSPPPPPMIIPTEETKSNLGKVHYQLACLHGMGRFSEISEDPDVGSIVFHLSHASSLRNVSACIALGRLRAGLDSCIAATDCLRGSIPIDFDSAKDLFQRAMETSASYNNSTKKYSSSRPKAAAGCLLLQMLHEEEGTKDVTLVGVIEDILALLEEADKEDEELLAHTARMKRAGPAMILVGDRVEANFALEGTYYPATVVSLQLLDGESITVRYDDDGSEETHTSNNVRPLIPMTASTTSVGLSDEDALGGESEGEKCILEAYTLKAELAHLKAKMGNVAEAATLFEDAAQSAMDAGKMKTAAECSAKAAELAC